MSLKAIEMQIALPRTQDAGKIQEQLQQRSQIAIDSAANEVKREEKKKEQSVIAAKKARQQKVGEDSGKMNQTNLHSGHNLNCTQEEKEELSHHPYKGNRIDFSG
ncbi:hypothetical protein [Bacillus sp. 1P06AnD]|uniref:hypothetical protein n=1 Tax=Bacillus sp. 1P06AnD TaxID=3132208 RepID=UPI0039A094B5